MPASLLLHIPSPPTSNPAGSPGLVLSATTPRVRNLAGEMGKSVCTSRANPGTIPVMGRQSRYHRASALIREALELVRMDRPEDALDLLGDEIVRRAGDCDARIWTLHTALADLTDPEEDHDDDNGDDAGIEGLRRGDAG